MGVEGDIDTITKQLQLLPPSKKILIVSPTPVNHSRQRKPPASTAHGIVQEVQAAFADRVASARFFLKSSTPSHPRLVFMNGGSLSARATCIQRISENVTQGDVNKAEAIFNDIVKAGPAGLERDAAASRARRLTKEEADLEGLSRQSTLGPREIEDPNMRAMMAAESLDRETAVLQHVSGEQTTHGGVMCFTPVTPQPRLSDIPWMPKDFPRGIPEARGVSQVKASNYTADDFDFLHTSLNSPSRASSVADSRSTFGGRRPRPTVHTIATTSVYSQPPDEEESDGLDQEDLSNPKQSGDLFSARNSLLIEFGEAYVVDVAQSPEPDNAVKRIKSVDRFYPGFPKAHEAGLSPRPLKHTTSDPRLRPRRLLSSVDDERPASLYTLPRATFVRASETNIKKSTKSGLSPSPSTSKFPLRVLVDHRANEHEFEPSPITPIKEETGLQEPLFPIEEDLIIHFTEGPTNAVLDSVLRTCKFENYCVSPISPPVETVTARSSRSVLSPLSINSQVANSLRSRDPDLQDVVAVGPNGLSSADHPKETRPPTRRSPALSGPEVQKLEVVTPPSTSPVLSDNSEKICEFSPISSKHVIAIQNAFREFLNQYFPSGEKGYSQHYYSITPEMDRLWKPVFRYDESKKANGDRTVDQIIAFGCEEGVNKEFFSRISGQVEKIGTKKEGESRSGKLDLRYGLVALYQTFTPLTMTDTSLPKLWSDSRTT